MQACAFSNLYAPEHLIVNVEEPESWLDSIDNAGENCIGSTHLQNLQHSLICGCGKTFVEVDVVKFNIPEVSFANVNFEGNENGNLKERLILRNLDVEDRKRPKN